MFRCGSALIIAWTLLASAAPAHAQWYNFWSGWSRDYHRNQAWPEPFLMPDRVSVMQPLAMQVANGWRRQNLLSDYHFNEQTAQLNLAGETKLRFILTQMPPSRRTVFVQRGLSPEITALRMEKVQTLADRMISGGGIASVVESDLPNEGWPADEIDSITRGFAKTRPDPRIKSAGDSTAGTGGGSGSN